MKCPICKSKMSLTYENKTNHPHRQYECNNSDHEMYTHFLRIITHPHHIMKRTETIMSAEYDSTCPQCRALLKSVMRIKKQYSRGELNGL